MGVALIFHGRGGDLGNFEVFAASLATQLRLAGKHVRILGVERRDEFFEHLRAPPLKPHEKIAELHVFAHSIGAGLFLAYGDAAINASRMEEVEKADRASRRLTYEDVLKLEVGCILTDDLIREPYVSYRPTIVAQFAPTASVKLWGCNTGIKGWVYNDNRIADPRSFNAPYYWRALNERNVPKPSVAKALATYLQRTVYGASSGSHIEVLHKGKWVLSSAYKATVGQWPSGALVHRLNPDRGQYDAYSP